MDTINLLRRAPLSSGLVLALLGACASEGGYIDSGCYRIVWGHVTVNHNTGTVNLNSLCVERTNPVCTALGKLEYEGGVDQNGNGSLDAGEAGTTGSAPSDGNTACATNLNLDFDPQKDRGKTGIFHVRVTDQNGGSLVDRKSSKRI